MFSEGSIILASASPRRAELMAMANIPCTIVPTDIPEDVLPDELPNEHAIRLSRDKALAAAKASPGARIYIGADTIVVLDGRIMGKPATEDEAREMLTALSGQAHEVITGVTVIDRESGVTISRSVDTEVQFKNLSEKEINDYIATGCPMDKAGAYAIQGGAAHFVREINGSYTNVIGLPMAELYELLQALA